MNREIITRKGQTRVQWTITMLVNSIIFTYGLQSGWVSPMIKVLKSSKSPVDRPLTDSEISLIAGVPALSSMIGLLMIMYTLDNYGRKKSLFLVTGFQLISWIIKLCPSTLYSLLVARLFSGLAAGSSLQVILIYVKEVSQQSIRGTLASMSSLLQSLGIFTMYAIGGYMDYETVLYLVVGVPVATMAMLCIVPESPSFLMKQDKPEKAAEVIAFLRGLDVNDKEVWTEIALLQREDDYYKSIPNVSFLKIFKNKAWRHGFIIMLTIIIAHALNGAFALIAYASPILANSQLKISPEVQSLFIPIFLMIGSLIMMTSIDHVGRKLLLGTTFFVSALAFGGLGSVLLFRDYGWFAPEWLPVTLIFVTVCCYGAGISSGPYVIITEMFQFQICAKIFACLCTLAWMLTFVQLVAFTAIASTIGAYASFYIFSAINVFGVICVAVLLPETGRKSIDQIEQQLRGHDKFEQKKTTSE